MSTCCGFQRLKDITLSFKIIMTKPCIDPKDPCSIIIASHGAEANKGIFRFNINKNKMHRIYKYDDFDEISMVQGQFIDPKNEILYLLSNGHSSFIPFNLNKKEIESFKSNHVKINGYLSSTIYLPSPMEQIHFSDGDGNHFRYSIKYKTIQQSLSLSKLEGRQFLYVPSKGQLMNFGKNKILNCFIDHQRCSQNHYFWRINKLKMPYDISSMFELINFNVLLGFENIIFLFYFPSTGCKQIYCLDLLNMKWVKTKYVIPNCITSPFNIFVFKIGDNVHLIDFFSKYHFKIDLYDLTPFQVIKSHRKYYKSFILDYLRNKQRKNGLIPLPFALKILIVQYFPL